MLIAGLMMPVFLSLTWYYVNEVATVNLGSRNLLEDVTLIFWPTSLLTISAGDRWQPQIWALCIAGSLNGGLYFLIGRILVFAQRKKSK